MDNKIFLVGNIVILAAQESDADLLDLIFKLLVHNMPKEAGA